MRTPEDGQRISPGTDTTGIRDGHKTSPACSHGAPNRQTACGTTPSPVVASASRTDSPSVSTM